MARLLVAVIALVALLSVASAATYKFRSIVPKQVRAARNGRGGQKCCGS